jgi:uncharacterized RDD family membrane protein YckC
MEAQIQATTGDHLDDFPTLSRRFQSLLIDQVFIIFCMLIFSLLLPNFNPGSAGGLRVTLFLGLFLVYEPFCISFGCTLGNYLSGTRVRKFGEEGKRISLISSYLRFVAKLFLGIISFFTVTSNAWKRGIHDMAAGSVMIYNVKK